MIGTDEFVDKNIKYYIEEVSTSDVKDALQSIEYDIKEQIERGIYFFLEDLHFVINRNTPILSLKYVYQSCYLSNPEILLFDFEKEIKKYDCIETLSQFKIIFQNTLNLIEDQIIELRNENV